MFTKIFWRDTFERVIRTAAAAGIPAFSAAGLDKIDYTEAVGLMGSAAVVTLLMCLGSAGLGQKGTAGVVDVRNG